MTGAARDLAFFAAMALANGLGAVIVICICRALLAKLRTPRRKD